MVSIYPQSLDTFRDYLEGFDYLQGFDLTDLFDAAASVQTEIGLLPSGKKGTVSARLFENGNLSEAAAGWNRLMWASANVAQSSKFAHNPSISLSGYRIDFNPDRFSGKDSGFGEGVPSPFGALQGPLNSGIGSNNRGAVPWRSLVSRADTDFAEWVAVDGENDAINNSNTAPCRWGYIIWNLIT